MNNPLKYTDPTGYRMAVHEIIERERGGGGYMHASNFGANIDWENPYGGMESAYYSWSNLYYNGVTNTSFEDFVNNKGNYKLNGRGVEHFSGNGALADAEFYLRKGIKASVGVGEAQPDYEDWTNYNPSGYANEYFAQSEGDMRINLGKCSDPYGVVVDFLRALPHDPDMRGLTSEYFSPNFGKKGKSNGNYATRELPVTVRGHDVVITIQFHPWSHLTGVVKLEQMKNLDLRMEYDIRATGPMEAANDGFRPWLIRIHYPAGATDLVRSTNAYIWGRSDTW